MFTGLVADLGRVTDVERSDAGVVMTVSSNLAGEVAAGDSVAVNGVCLTATSVTGEAFSAEVMNETLTRSSLDAVAPGRRVNLELALRAGDRLGGHFMQGHIDGVGMATVIEEDGFARRVRFSAAGDVLRYIVEKGSISVDGVSLTVVDVDATSFSVSLIPETLERTTLGSLAPGDKVNLEVDVLAKYVEKAIQGYRP